MLNFIKNLLLGFIIGSYVSFVTYYLLSPRSGTNLTQLIFWGGQGILFASVYEAFSFCLKLIKLHIFIKDYWIKNIIIGVLCGIIVAALNAIYHYKTITSGGNGIVSSEFKKVLINDLLHIGFGFLLIGVAIGITLGYLEKLKK